MVVGSFTFIGVSSVAIMAYVLGSAIALTQLVCCVYVIGSFFRW